MCNLRPHGEKGGNQLFYLVREADNLDKHRLLIPAIDYASMSREAFLRLVPDWPEAEFKSITITGWPGRLRWLNFSVPPDQLGSIGRGQPLTEVKSFCGIYIRPKWPASWVGTKRMETASGFLGPAFANE
jgi:hypothetical protein